MRYLLAVLLVSACAREEPPPPPAKRTTPVAPGAPMNVAVPDEVRVKLDLSAARTAIQMQFQQSGKYPPSLSALNLKLHYPADMSYDPASGAITSRTYPRF